jgi:hypothetical protein
LLFVYLKKKQRKKQIRKKTKKTKTYEIYTDSFSLLLAVRGDMPNRDEDNSNQKDGSFNPLPGEDRSCQGAVDGDIDGGSLLLIF